VRKHFNVLRNAVRCGRCDEDYAERCLERLRIAVDYETNRLIAAADEGLRLAETEPLLSIDEARETVK